jgi:hypothetical protein
MDRALDAVAGDPLSLALGEHNAEGVRETAVKVAQASLLRAQIEAEAATAMTASCIAMARAGSFLCTFMFTPSRPSMT